LNNKVKREKEREREKKKGSRKRRRTLNYLSLRQLFVVVTVCGAVGFSGLCPCCPVKPRPIGALNLPGLFPSPGLFSNLNGMDRGVGSTVGGFGSAGSSGSNGSGAAGQTGGFHLDAATPGSVEELRRKAHEHSAALLHSLQQHAMEFHLQQQQHQQQQRKNKEANESESNSQSD
jgi:hypothetical protein